MIRWFSDISISQSSVGTCLTCVVIFDDRLTAHFIERASESMVKIGQYLAKRLSLVFWLSVNFDELTDPARSFDSFRQFLMTILFSLTGVTSALEVFWNGMRYINPRFTYLLYFLCTLYNCNHQVWLLGTLMTCEFTGQRHGKVIQSGDSISLPSLPPFPFLPSPSFPSHHLPSPALSSPPI